MSGTVPSTKKTVGEESIVVFGIQIWILLSSLAIQSALAWSLGPEGRGAYAVCFVFATTSAAILALGVDRAAQFMVMSKRLSLSRAVSVALGVALIGFLAAMIFGRGVVNSSLSLFQKASPSAFEISLFLIPLLMLTQMLGLQLQGMRRYARSGLVSVVRRVTQFLLVLVLVVGLGWGVESALIALMGGAVIAVILLVWDLRKNCGFNVVRVRWRHVRPIMSYGARCYPAGIGHIIDLQIGTLILGLISTQAEIGLYAAILALCLKVLIISQSLETAILPRLVGSSGERQSHLVGASIRITWLFTGVAMLGLLAVSVPLVSIVLSPKFLPAAPLMWILAPGIVIQAGSKVLVSFFRAINRPEIVSWATWVSLLVNVLIILVLYTHIGLSAAAWGMTIGFTCRAIVLLTAYRRVTGEGLSAIFCPCRGDLELAKALILRLQTRLFPTKNPNV